jgi:hypothetical protein
VQELVLVQGPPELRLQVLPVQELVLVQGPPALFEIILL